ncbi:DCC1-like thiol-disulfide oxidoreductase family protein [Streptomyces sp. NPDC058525]|uniref:DCC1-like thiol-disulfide oxidoreductase family protein n=1 Tax=unclassified Streptomyces TaxID=2593676 RepID=UPI00365CD702
MSQTRKLRLTELLDTAGSRPFSVLGVSGTRLLLGFVGFMYYASQYGDRGFLFGPDGVYPWAEFTAKVHEGGTFSLYTLSSSTLWFEIVFHAGILAALAVTCGVGGRPVLAVHWVLLWSIYQRQPVLLDGGDNLAYVVIPMLLLTRCYERLSFPTGLARTLARRVPPVLRSLSTPLHNLGVLAVAVQMCLVYVVSGLYKVQGRMWQDGTALFYVLRVSEFRLPGVSELVYGNDYLVFIGTYSTTLFLVYFPLGVLVPRLRPWAAVVSIGFHVSIGFVMGLTGFALTMVACDLVFLSGALETALHRARTALRRREPLPAGAVLAFDGDCGFCQAAVDRITTRARPALRAAPWQSLPAEDTDPHVARLDREVLLLADGRVLAGGAQALAHFVRDSPVRRYRLASVLLRAPGLRACAAVGYRWVADNRQRMPGSSNACTLPSSSKRT